MRPLASDGDLLLLPPLTYIGTLIDPVCVENGFHSFKSREQDEFSTNSEASQRDYDRSEHRTGRAGN